MKRLLVVLLFPLAACGEDSYEDGYEQGYESAKCEFNPLCAAPAAPVPPVPPVGRDTGYDGYLQGLEDGEE